MIAPDDHVEPSSNQTEDNTILNNLSSHLSGELPGVELNQEKATEVASAEVASESPQQHAPEPLMTTNISEQSIPEHSVPEQTGSEHIPSPPPSENPVEFDGMITSEVSDEEIEQSSSMEIEQSASDLPSTSNTQSIHTNSLRKSC